MVVDDGVSFVLVQNLDSELAHTTAPVDLTVDGSEHKPSLMRLCFTEQSAVTSRQVDLS